MRQILNTFFSQVCLKSHFSKWLSKHTGEKKRVAVFFFWGHKIWNYYTWFTKLFVSQIQVFKYHDSAKNFFPFFFWDILGPKTMQDIWDSKCCPSQNSMQNQGACILPCESPIRLWITVVIIRLLPLMHMKKEFKEGIWHGFSFWILFFKIII